MSVKCAECQCAPQDCTGADAERCIGCTKDICCCATIHSSYSTMKKPMAMAETTTAMEPDNCCPASGCCKNNNDALEHKVTSSQSSSSGLSRFLSNIKGLYAAALGIEILCIAAAEIGENSGLYLFGFNVVGIPIAYAMGYALAGFTTFAAILGRYNYSSNDNIDSCCSVLEQGAGSGFISNLKTTFRNFVVGIAKLPQLHRQPNLKYVLKTSAYILVTAESACILTAETVDLVFYQYSLLLSVPLALVAGAFAAVTPLAFVKAKVKPDERSDSRLGNSKRERL
jgi:hypothetical protein